MGNKKIKRGDKIISPEILNDDLKQVINKCWSYNLESPNINKFRLIHKPFKVCKLRNFVTSPLGTYDFRGEVLSLHHKKRGNDLMQLEESVCDLQNVTPRLSHSENVECINLFCKEMLTDFKPWLERVTGIQLNDTLSVRTSRYTDTDFLLCHNDQIEDRRIAFILYLSKDWKEDYGGALNLFESQDKVPTKIKTSIFPKFNSLLFFEVTNESFHSVSEILKDVSRFSVNGWFHGTVEATDPPSRIERAVHYSSPVDRDSLLLPVYIRDTRLSNNKFAEIINKVMEMKSFCGIKNFFKRDQFDQLLREIESNIHWSKVGPPDQKNYYVAHKYNLPDHLKNFVEMFSTVAFCQLLKKYTDLSLVPDYEGHTPEVTFELQKWNQGCYTVLHDGNVAEEEDEDIAEPEEEEEEPERPVTNERENSINYSVEDMLADITVDASNISTILPLLNSSLQQARDDSQPGPSTSSGTVEESGPGPSKKRRTEPAVTNETSVAEDNEPEDNSGSESGTPGTLDVVVYFHANNAPKDTTLNYVDPRREDGVFLTLPIEDNTLFLVFREEGVVRHNAYVNHHCKGSFYSLVFSYKE